MGSVRTRHPARRITQWVQGGAYAVAVEVSAQFPLEDPSEPCLKPETVRMLESLAASAAAGEVEPLRQAGKVYVRIE